MTLCSFCRREQATWTCKEPVVKNGREVFSHYCPTCAKNGVAFGWLEKEELQKVET